MQFISRAQVWLTWSLLRWLLRGDRFWLPPWSPRATRELAHRYRLRHHFLRINQRRVVWRLLDEFRADLDGIAVDPPDITNSQPPSAPRPSATELRYLN